MNELDPWDRALMAALSGDAASEDLETIEELSISSGLSSTLLEALSREGLLIPQTVEREPLFHPEDARAVRAGVELVEAGVPLAELLHLARLMDEAMRPIAAQSVDVFVRFVRDSVEASAEDEDEATQRLLTAFRKMLPAAGEIVEHHFRRLVIAAALERLGSD